MKNPTMLIVLATIIVGVGFLGALIVSNRDEVKESSDVVEIATNLGLDTDMFIQDYESQEISDLVEAQRVDALGRLGGNASTPSVFINGEIYIRTNEITTLETLSALVDEANQEDSQTTLPIVVEVFEDYNCSACAAYQKELFEIENTFDVTQVDLQKKHLPFLKETSTKYAKAAEAARKQGKFNEYNMEVFMKNFPNLDFSYYGQ